MEIIENMYYGIGQIALAIALADGDVDRAEMNALETCILNVEHEKNRDLSGIITSFKVNHRDTSKTSQELLTQGIRNFHLGDLHLTPELAKTFRTVLVELTKVKKWEDAREMEILESFLSYLEDRSKLAKYRDRGYLKNVLIPVDLEEKTVKALSNLSDLEKWMKLGFYINLVHCVAPEDLKGETFYRKKEAALIKLNEMVANYFPKENEKGQIEIEVLFQRLEYLDQAYLDKKEIDFVIMPTKGKVSDDYKHSTNTSDHIQRHFANYLVLPTTAKIETLNDILVVTDYQFTTLDQFEPVLELCVLHDARITLLSLGKNEQLSERQKEKKKALESYFEGYIEACVHQIVNEYVYQDIINVIADSEYNLLVALPLHNSFYNRFDGHLSVVKKLCQLTTIPLLVLNQHPKRKAMEKIINQKEMV